ncbi:hypothetical protein LTR37_020680 [Vermiconidia calcicola]|uniref:Uncharacterized protein n=1 Tax=Vermiconidia calcicola TaxID=1690605 RepID=A0ACC3MAK1_9PEZI|nr:hypothetical protein LTR37_020680 [Vermiconidia calcicola]
MNKLERRTVKVGRGFTYSYHITPGANSAPKHAPFLFHHGWPDSHVAWSKVAEHLASLPNSLVIPDMLGYGESEKPKDVKALAYDGMARDMVDILDAEGIDKVISVGHDHGSIPAQRLYNLHTDRVAALILFNIPYMPPNKTGPAFSIDGFNQWATQTFGYPTYEYWNFFALDPEAPQIMSENVSRVWEACHTTNMKRLFCIPGAFREYLTNHSLPSQTLKDYAYGPELKDAWIQNISAGGFEAPLNYYKAVVQDVHRESDQKVKDEDVVVQVPLLFIGGKQDPVCRPELGESIADPGLLPNLTTVVVDTGHWPMLEKPEEVGNHVIQFLMAKGL